jgi:Transglycosylase-like domain
MGTPQRNILLAVAGIAMAALLALTAVTASGAGLERSKDWLVPRVDKRHKELYDGKWKRVVKPANKRWARRVAACESGMNPDALGADGIYRGAFQFGEGTWKSAPKSPGGDPIAYSYRTQAFVAVRLKGRDGAGHWPNCP